MICLQIFGVLTRKAPAALGAMAEENNGSFFYGNAPGAGTSRHAQPWSCRICRADRGWTTDMLASGSTEDSPPS
jgi:hypothetical protein